MIDKNTLGFLELLRRNFIRNVIHLVRIGREGLGTPPSGTSFEL
jgi:hypothetical protein